MTGYPPKCPQNGTRNHTVVADSSGIGWENEPDAWPGDTDTLPDGSVWQLGRDGATWTRIKRCATATEAA